jgi:hypothetical protein
MRLPATLCHSYKDDPIGARGFDFIIQLKPGALEERREGDPI